MTQFMLCVLDPEAPMPSQLEFRPIEHCDSWLQEVARALFPRCEVRIPRTKNGISIDGVFTEAHNALYNGREFDVTQLEHVLPEMLNTCKSVALWWGDEWQDLPVISSEAKLLSELKRQLAAPVGDVYLLWNRDVNDAASPP
ncbi:MAG: hypothetical protein ACTHQM_25360 [Thermoanaerobaculia bacterium]